jgi:hypothetical protein
MRLRAVAVAAALVGCGRIGFGTTDRDGPPGGGDDAPAVPDARACTAGTDSCNGIDDDCDGSLDEDCACAAFTLRVMTSAAQVDAPALAWTGDGYIVATSSVTGLYLQHVSATGDLDSVPNLVATGASANRTSGVFTGADLALTWLVGSEASFGVMHPDASRTVPDRTLGTVDQGPFLAWNGERIAMVSEQSGFPIEFARYTGTGQYGGGTGLVGISDEIRSNAFVGIGFVVGMREVTNPRAARFYDWAADAGAIGSLRTVGGNRVGFVDAATAGGRPGTIGTVLIDNSGVVLLPHDLAGAATSPEQVIEAAGAERSAQAVGIAWSGAHYYAVATFTGLIGGSVDVIETDPQGAAVAAIETLPAPLPTGLVAGKPTVISPAEHRIAAAWFDTTGGSVYLDVIQRCDP